MYENRCELCYKDKKDGKKLSLMEGKGVYVGESSRSLYERAREHQADKNNRSDDSHQIKHWITDHQDLLAPPKFKFKIIQTFQDPLSRQLAEAVRIELRGENILNSKGEFNRCKVPRLTIDLENWKSKKKAELEIIKEAGEGPQEQGDHQDWIDEAEESLGAREIKRKRAESPVKGRAKKRKLNRLIGWGEGSSLQEGISTHQEEYSSPVEELATLDEVIEKERDALTPATTDVSRQTALKGWSRDPKGQKTETKEENNKRKVEFAEETDSLETCSC